MHAEPHGGGGRSSNLDGTLGDVVKEGLQFLVHAAKWEEAALATAAAGVEQDLQNM